MVLGNAQVHPTIAVTDIAKAKEFYGTKLGLKEVGSVMSKGDDLLFKLAGGTHLYVYKRPQPAGSTATVCSFEVDDVDGVVKKLQGNGVRFEEYDMPEMGIKTKNGVATMNGLKSAWFKDPSGNILAIGNAIATSQKTGEATTARH